MEQLLKIYGVSAAIAAVIAALFNLLFKAWIDHQAVKATDKLRDEQARNMESLRAENQRTLEAQRVMLERGSYKYTRLHDLRLSTIEEIMSRIGYLELALNPMVGWRKISGDEAIDRENMVRMLNEAAEA